MACALFSHQFLSVAHPDSTVKPTNTSDQTIFPNLVHILYTKDTSDIDWHVLRAAFIGSGLRDGRSAMQLSQSFNKSQGRCFAHVENMPVGTARAVSDRTQRAYIADVWTHPTYRRCGVATSMIHALLKGLFTQHVYVFTTPLWLGLYTQFGFEIADRQLPVKSKTYLVERAPGPLE